MTIAFQASMVRDRVGCSRFPISLLLSLIPAVSAIFSFKRIYVFFSLSEFRWESDPSRLLLCGLLNFSLLFFFLVSHRFFSLFLFLVSSLFFETLCLRSLPALQSIGSFPTPGTHPIHSSRHACESCVSIFLSKGERTPRKVKRLLLRKTEKSFLVF